MIFSEVLNSKSKCQVFERDTRTIEPDNDLETTIKPSSNLIKPEKGNGSSIMRGIQQPSTNPSTTDGIVDTDKEFVQVAKQQSDNKKQRYPDWYIKNFINNCIPSEFEQDEEAVTRAWLLGQLRTHGIQYSTDIIRYALRSFFMVKQNRKGLGSQTVDSIINSAVEKFKNIDTDDSTAIAKLKSNSVVLGDGVIATIVSDLSTSRLSLRQQIYDDLAGILGQQYSATKISAFIRGKYQVNDGIFLLFRNLNDPGIYSNVVIDLDRRWIWGGQSTSRLRLITDRATGELDEARLYKLIVLNNNDKREQSLYIREARFLTYLQYMMNSDKIPEIYELLRSRDEGTSDEWRYFSGDDGAKDPEATSTDPQKIANRKIAIRREPNKKTKNKE